MRRWILLLLALTATVTVRCWNHQQVFVGGAVYFVDADCYSRMTRVRELQAHPGTVLRHHDFENWPQGISPHTTMPLDWLIAALALVPGVGRDLAGAWLGPLLAAATAGLLWWWSGRFRFFTQVAVLLLFAVSPILVHGTALGRPDHQALLIFLLTAAWITEWRMADGGYRTAGWHGLAWGLALWTSLFEPSILWAVTLAAGVVVHRGRWFRRERAVAVGVTVAVLLLALGVEHWRSSPLPGGALFTRWARSIGELTAPGVFSSVFLHWSGWAVLWIPLLAIWRTWRDKSGINLPWIALLVVTGLGTAGMMRWGYFFVLTLLFVLPCALEQVRSRWVMALFFAGFWPVAVEWDRMLDRVEGAGAAEQTEDYRQLRQICAALPADEGVIAPWWLSPPVAYWSGVRCVAGSSHQSLPGIVDTALFYSSPYSATAREILERRQVQWVIAYEPDRVLATASSLLDISPTRAALAVTLYETPDRAPSYMTLIAQTPYFKLYHVAP